MTSTSAVGLAVGRWLADPARSTATFRVSSLGRTVTGTVPITEGTVDIAAGGLPSAITGSLDLGAIDTGNARRDKDLRKPKLLDLDRYPTMTFVADTITASPAGWRVAGISPHGAGAVLLATQATARGTPRRRQVHVRLRRAVT